jgi:8-amino-3,8-dideoxy-alpha-D-manno-octulosonate transaminase
MFNAIDIEINTECNYRCEYCPNKTHYRGAKYLDDDMFTKIILELKQVNFSGRVSLNLYGEPFMHPKIITYIKMIRRRVPACNLSLYTNGVFLNEIILNRIAHLVNKFIITQHYDFTEDKKTLFKKYKNIDLKKFTDDDILHNRCGIVKAKIANKKSSVCWGKYKTAYINYKGDMILCCNDFLGISKIGNVKNKTLLELWKKLSVIKDGLRAEKYPAVCKECNYIKEETK